MRKVKRKDIAMGQDIHKEVIEAVTELGVKLQSVLVGNDGVSIEAAEDVAKSYNRLNLALTNMYTSDALSSLESIDEDVASDDDNFYWFHKPHIRLKLEDAIEAVLDRVISGSDSEVLGDQLEIMHSLYTQCGTSKVRNVSLTELPDNDINRMLKG